MKTVRTAPSKPQPSRPIKRFSPLRHDPPAPAPAPPVSRPAPSNEFAAGIVRKAQKRGGSIEPRQMRT
jgi:hypothetical protein